MVNEVDSVYTYVIIPMFNVWMGFIVYYCSYDLTVFYTGGCLER